MEHTCKYMCTPDDVSVRKQTVGWGQEKQHEVWLCPLFRVYAFFISHSVTNSSVHSFILIAKNLFLFFSAIFYRAQDIVLPEAIIRSTINFMPWWEDCQNRTTDLPSLLRKYQTRLNFLYRAPHQAECVGSRRHVCIKWFRKKKQFLMTEGSRVLHNLDVGMTVTKFYWLET